LLVTRRPPLVDRLRLGVPGPEDLQRERHASWLELFFDLAFVLALFTVTRRLGMDPSPTIGEIATVVGLFVLVQWAWAGVSFFDTRFDPDDVPHRLLVLLASAGAGAVALGVDEVPASPLVPIGYLVVRGSLLLMYLRVRGSGPAGREISSVYLTGFGIGWLLWLGSLAVPPTWRPAVWAVAFAIELLTPWVTLDRLARYPVHPTHLPERIGQFTIILLGSTLNDLLRAVPATRPPAHVLAAALVAFVIPASIWWLYTGLVSRRQEPSRLRGGQTYIYLHIPHGASLLLLGWAIGQAVAEVASDSHRLSVALRLVLAGSLVARLLCSIGLHASAFGPLTRGDLAAALSGVVTVAIVAVTVTDPFLTLGLLAAATVGQGVVTTRLIERRVSHDAG
jgi:low temperature requirement protein LtrA